MKKPIVGIISSILGFNNDDPFADRYYVLNNYTKKLLECGMIPISIVFDDQKVIKESLELCDGFVFPGGTIIRSYHFEVLDYAIKHNKPVLGTCMGMQIMGLYSVNNLNEGSNLYKIENDINHWPLNIMRKTIDTTAHDVNIDKNSLLYDIFNVDKLAVNSLHNYGVREVGKNFRIVARADDNTIEGIEYISKDHFILGVQWHPEVVAKYDSLWNRFRMECEKRI